MNERKKRQSEVSKAGLKTEQDVVNLLNGDKEIKKNLIVERFPQLPRSLKEKLKPLLTVNYECGEELIDADICVIDKKTLELLAVISVKKSFRERGAQAAYWALKLRLLNKPFKYVLATPDVDREIFDPENPQKKKKWRVILPCEFEKVFVYSYDGKIYNEGNLFVGKDYLIDWVKSLLLK